MSDNLPLTDNRDPDKVDPNTRASILQGTFNHYFGMAMDHHSKAATTSNFLLLIVGALISFISLDGSLGGPLDLLSGLAVFVIGLFGAAWSWKQHERYYFWQDVAYRYQQELVKIVPEFETGREYYAGAEAEAEKVYTRLFAKTIHERWLWVSLHGIVAAVGLGLVALSAGVMVWNFFQNWFGLALHF